MARPTRATTLLCGKHQLCNNKVSPHRSHRGRGATCTFSTWCRVHQQACRGCVCPTPRQNRGSVTAAQTRTRFKNCHLQSYIGTQWHWHYCIRLRHRRAPVWRESAGYKAHANQLAGPVASCPPRAFYHTVTSSRTLRMGKLAPASTIRHSLPLLWHGCWGPGPNLTVVGPPPPCFRTLAKAL